MTSGEAPMGQGPDPVGPPSPFPTPVPSSPPTEGPPAPPMYWRGLSEELKLKLLQRRMLEINATMALRVETMSAMQQARTASLLAMSSQDKQDRLAQIAQILPSGAIDFTDPNNAKVIESDLDAFGRSLDPAREPDLVSQLGSLRADVGRRAEQGAHVRGLIDKVRTQTARLADAYRNRRYGTGSDLMGSVAKGAMFAPPPGEGRTEITNQVMDAVERYIQESGDRRILEDKDKDGTADDAVWTRARLRARLLREVADELEKHGLDSDSETIKILKGAGSLVGNVFGAKLIAAVGGAVLGGAAAYARAGSPTATAVSQALTKYPRLIPGLGISAGIGAAVMAQGAPKELQRYADASGMSEEDREGFLEAGTITHGLTAAAFLPFLHLAKPIGKAMTLGLGTKGLGKGFGNWIEMSLAFPIAAEIGGSVIDGARLGLTELAKGTDTGQALEDLAKVSPYVPGLIGSVLKSGYRYLSGGRQDGKEFKEAVSHYLKEVASSAVAFGSIQLLTGLGARELITPEMVDQAKTEVERLVREDKPEAAERIQRDLEALKPKETSRDELVAILGKDTANKLIEAEKVTIRRERALERGLEEAAGEKKPKKEVDILEDPAKKPSAREAQDRADELHEEAKEISMRAAEAKDPKERNRLEVEADAATSKAIKLADYARRVEAEDVDQGPMPSRDVTPDDIVRSSSNLGRRRLREADEEFSVESEAIERVLARSRTPGSAFQRRSEIFRALLGEGREDLAMATMQPFDAVRIRGQEARVEAVEPEGVRVSYVEDGKPWASALIRPGQLSSMDLVRPKGSEDVLWVVPDGGISTKAVSRMLSMPRREAASILASFEKQGILVRHGGLWRRTGKTLPREAALAPTEAERVVEAVVDMRPGADDAAIEMASRSAEATSPPSSEFKPGGSGPARLRNSVAELAPDPNGATEVGQITLQQLKDVENVRKSKILGSMWDVPGGNMRPWLEAEVSRRRGAPREFAVYAQMRPDLWHLPSEIRQAELISGWIAKRTRGLEREETIEVASKRYMHDLDQIMNAPTLHERAQEFMAWRTAEPRIWGPEAIAFRFHPEGVRFLDAYESAMAKIFGPSVARSGLPVLDIVRSVYPLVDPVTKVFGYPMQPESIVKLIEDTTAFLTRDPPTVANKAHTLFGNYFEGGLSYGGRVAVDALKTSSGTVSQVVSAFRAIKGHLEEAGITKLSELDQRLFRALGGGPESDAWKALSGKPLEAAKQIRRLLEDLRVRAATAHPTVWAWDMRLRGLRRLMERTREQADRMAERRSTLARSLDEMDDGARKNSTAEISRLGGLIKAKESRIEKFQAISADVTARRQEFIDTWGITKNGYIRHVRQNMRIGFEFGGDLMSRGTPEKARSSVERRRKLELDEGEDNPVIESVHVSVVDSVMKTIAWVEKNRFFRRWNEFLHGELRPVELGDLQVADKIGTYYDHPTYNIRRAFVSHGKYYYHPDHGAFASKPTGDKYTGVKWRDVILFESAEGGRYVGREALQRVSPKELKPETFEGHGTREPRFRVESPFYAADNYWVRRDGWFSRASPSQAHRVDQMIKRFETGISELKAEMFPADRLMRFAGRYMNSATIGLWNYGSASNAMAGALIHNASLIPAEHSIRAAKDSVVFLARLMRGITGVPGARAIGVARAAPFKELRLEAEMDPMDAARRGAFRMAEAIERMRTPTEKLASMDAKRRQAAIDRDEAMVALVNSPVFEGKIADMYHFVGQAVREYLGSEIAGRKSLKKHLSDVMAKADHHGFVFMAGAEMAVRSHLFLGTYRAAKDAGRSPEQARELAENAVLFSHGIFNNVVASAFFRGPLGPTLGGLQTWASHSFGAWLRAPTRYKVRFAAAAITAMYIAQWAGIGDWTNVVGTDAYGLPVIGPIAERAGLSAYQAGGKDIPIASMLLKGFAPFAMPSGESPLLGVAADMQRGFMEAEENKMSRALQAGLGRAAQAATPWFIRDVHKAFGSTKVEEGVYNVVPMFSNKRSVSLRQRGIEQLLASAAPGTQPEIAEASFQWRLQQHEKKMALGRRTQIRDDAKSLIKRREKLLSRGLEPTSSESQRWSEDWRAVKARAQEENMTIDVNDIRKSLAIEELPSPLRTAVAGGTNADKLRALSRVLDSASDGKSAIAETEIRQVQRILRGQKTFTEWLSGDSIPVDVRNQFKTSLRRFLATKRKP